MGVRIGTRPCHCDADIDGTHLIAVTGGPGAGKTAVLEMAARVFCHHVGVLPEAAGVVFGGGFPRHDGEPARRAAQRAIYHVQRCVEQLVLDEGRVAVGLCDRGTLDGVAYWPGSPEEYWQLNHTSSEAELARYAAVVHLQTPGAEHYNHDNVLRVESVGEARSLDDRIAAAWDGHARRVVVPAAADFLAKAVQVLTIVRDALPPCCQSHTIPLPLLTGGAAS